MIRWVWGFVDRPLATFADSAAFWCAATGSGLSPRRGGNDEFATFLPATGDACLKLQGTGDAGGAHLDFETADLAAATARLLDLGGRVRAAGEPGLVVAESPAGIAFCLTDHHGATTVPDPVDDSRLDQICLDVAPGRLAAELVFWSGLTGWAARPGRFPEFHYLDAPAGLPIRVLIQELGAERPGGAHPDFACADRAATRRRHEALGATAVGEGPVWTVMRDPEGGVYCLTDRHPLTGRLPAA